MKSLLITLVLALSVRLANSQPQLVDGGFVIHKLIVKNLLFAREYGKWVNQGQPNDQSEPLLSSTHYLLDKKMKQRKELPFIDPINYDLVSQPTGLFVYYLPPYVKRKKTPNQRIVFVYDTDTMVVDFVNIPEQIASEPPSIAAIYFKPGHYVFNLYGEPNLRPKDKYEAAWLNYYTYEGITPLSEPYLLKYGKLKYTAPHNQKSVRKYVIPSISIEQQTPFSVSVKLQGNFLGRITEETIQEQIISPYYKVEILKNEVWEEKLTGHDLNYLKDGDQVAGRWYDKNMLVQIFSTQMQNESTYEPGTYRISVLTEDKEMLTSSSFHLGMLPTNPIDRYQYLYRASNGFPNYTLDISDNISIHTPFYPLEVSRGDSTVSTYHFRFPFGLDDNIRRFGHYTPAHPEIAYLKHLLPLLSGRKVSVNDKPFTGRINYALYQSRISAASFLTTTITLYKIDYSNGKPVKSEILQDADLESEGHMIRSQE